MAHHTVRESLLQISWVLQDWKRTKLWRKDTGVWRLPYYFVNYDVWRKAVSNFFVYFGLETEIATDYSNKILFVKKHGKEKARHYSETNFSLEELQILKPE